MTREFKFQFRILTAQSAGLELGLPPSLAVRPALASSSSHPWLFLHLERPCTRGETLCIATWTSGYAQGRCYPSSGGCIPEGCVPGLGMDVGPFGQEILGSGGLVQKGRHGLHVGSSSGCVHPLDPWGPEGHAHAEWRGDTIRGREGPFKAQAKDVKAVPRWLFIAPHIQHALMNCID